MLENSTSFQIKPSEELAYWVGVVQSDGCLNVYHDKKRDKIYHRISVDVGEKSLPMLEKFRDVSNKVLNSRIRIYRCKNNVFKCTLGAKRLLKHLNSLNIKVSDPPTPPNWVSFDNRFLGAYLAGLIDGDGSISVRNKRNYCAIEIFSRNEQILLKTIIKTVLNCGVWIRKLKGCYGISFAISHKNYKFIENLVLQHLTIGHKVQKLNSFINKRRVLYLRLVKGSSSSLV